MLFTDDLPFASCRETKSLIRFPLIKLWPLSPIQLSVVINVLLRDSLMRLRCITVFLVLFHPETHCTSFVMSAGSGQRSKIGDGRTKLASEPSGFDFRNFPTEIPNSMAFLWKRRWEWILELSCGGNWLKRTPQRCAPGYPPRRWKIMNPGISGTHELSTENRVACISICNLLRNLSGLWTASERNGETVTRHFNVCSF